MPAAFAVRTSDMRVIATQSLRGLNHLPYVEIAQRPDLDWSNPSAPQIVGNCRLIAQMALMNRMSRTTSLNSQRQLVLVRLMVGSVNLGRLLLRRRQWTLENDFEFSHALGDLDVVLLRNGEPIYQMNGEPVGAASGDDNEVLDWRGQCFSTSLGMKAQRRHTPSPLKKAKS